MLTALEQAVLDGLLQQQGEPFETIRQQLAHAVVSRRELTGVGFFTRFEIKAGSPVRRDLHDLTLGSVGAEILGLKHGAGFVLFVRRGVVSMLEGYTYDEPWPAITDNFRVFQIQPPNAC